MPTSKEQPAAVAGRRHHNRRRRKRRARVRRADPQSATGMGMEEDAARTPTGTTPAVKPRNASVVTTEVTPQGSPTNNEPTAGSQPPVMVATRNRTTQTAPRYTFGEADIVDLLIKFEHLVEQESEARLERVSHEPAVPLVRRLLRDGKPLPDTLPVARPLIRNFPQYDHVGEKDWVDFSAEEEDSMDDDDPLPSGT